MTADWDYSCGLRTDGTVACWGLARVVPPPSDVVTGTESTLVDRDECRQRGTRGSTTAGFPLPLSALPSTGTLRVAVLFVDFPDAVAPHSTLHEAELGLPFMDRFLEASSYGQLRVEAVPHHGWLRAEHGYGHYLHGSSVGSESVALGIAEEAIGLADAAFDFNGIDALMIVHPSSHFGGGSTAQERVDTQEGTVRTLLVNTFRVDGPEVGREWGAIAAHELLHNLGLVDLYAYDASRHEAPADTGHEAWFPHPVRPDAPECLQSRGSGRLSPGDRDAGLEPLASSVGSLIRTCSALSRSLQRSLSALSPARATGSPWPGCHCRIPR